MQHSYCYFYRPQRSCGQGNVFTGVCLSTRGGGCLPQCMLGCHTPPGTRQTPPDREPPPMENPPGWRAPPRWRTTTPPDGGPPGKQTPAYGLRAAGTHPTGMHSCLLKKLSLLLHITNIEILTVIL